ncbi:MAG: hypothetical protein PHU86_02135 [Patescibacteria group bacterium]|nr:hypothetical protein [Patescibacteria group bacterium]
MNNKQYSINKNGDLGVLMRIRNPWHKKFYLFVCAGLGEWGTSGSAYYLFQNWKQLYKENKNKDFCYLIRVRPDSDESAIIEEKI